MEDPEWKEAHIRFYEKYNSDMEKMQEIAVKVQKLIEPPKVERRPRDNESAMPLPRFQLIFIFMIEWTLDILNVKNCFKQLFLDRRADSL